MMTFNAVRFCLQYQPQLSGQVARIGERPHSNAQGRPVVCYPNRFRQHEVSSNRRQQISDTHGLAMGCATGIERLIRRPDKSLLTILWPICDR